MATRWQVGATSGMECSVPTPGGAWEFVISSLKGQRGGESDHLVHENGGAVGHPKEADGGLVVVQKVGTHATRLWVFRQQKKRTTNKSNDEPVFLSTSRQQRWSPRTAPTDSIPPPAPPPHLVAGLVVEGLELWLQVEEALAELLHLGHLCRERSKKKQFQTKRDKMRNDLVALEKSWVFVACDCACVCVCIRGGG